MNGVEGRYGIMLRPDNTVTIGHYPDSETGCAHGLCQNMGYYRATVEKPDSRDALERWFCATHVRELLEVITSETEFRRKVA
jgi:hypothetical protein